MTLFTILFSISRVRAGFLPLDAQISALPDTRSCSLDFLTSNFSAAFLTKGFQILRHRHPFSFFHDRALHTSAAVMQTPSFGPYFMH